MRFLKRLGMVMMIKSPPALIAGETVPGEKGSRGFSLMELILVLVMVSILSVAAVAILSDTSMARLNGTAWKVASDLRYAQELAMNTHGTYFIQFSVAGDWYALSAKDSTSVVGRDPFTGNAYIVRLNRDSYAGVTLDYSDWDGPTLLAFDRKGVPSSGGKIRLASGGETKTITVLGETGLVRLE